MGRGARGAYVVDGRDRVANGDRGERDEHKGGLRTSSAGQPTGSLDEWGGGREERTTPMSIIESGIVTEVSSISEKACCARNSAGQPAGSLDEWDGGREERTAPMDVTESPMVTDLSAEHR